VQEPSHEISSLNEDRGSDPVYQQIMEAAHLLFQRFGYKKTTMEDIAREAGKGKSSLYYYFKTKEEIFRETMLQTASKFVLLTQQEIQKATDLKAKLWAAASARTKLMYDKKSHMHVIHQEMPELVLQMPWIRTLIFEGASEMFAQQFRHILEEAIRTEEIIPLTEAQVDLYAHLFSMSAFGLELPLVYRMPEDFACAMYLKTVEDFHHLYART
jgi:AcrR family transcriptional regulator